MEEWSTYLLGVGDGTEPAVQELGKHMIRIPDKLVLKDASGSTSASAEDLIDYVYGDMPPVTQSMHARSKYFGERAILSPKNVDVNAMNDLVMMRVPGDERTYLSADSVSFDDEHAQHYPIEFLNTLEMSGLPTHELKLKVGACVMLLRNLDPDNGLCNGSRLIVTHLGRNIIRGTLTSGTHAGTTVMIPRITLIPSDTRFPFTLRRRQFPIKLAFVMTINKSQGQTFERLGLYLPRPVFGHGQLYVAFSRCSVPPSNGRTVDGVKVLIVNNDSHGEFPGFDGIYTHNIVYHSIL